MECDPRLGLLLPAGPREALLLPADASFQVLQGYISIKGHQFRVRICFPQNKSRTDKRHDTNGAAGANVLSRSFECDANLRNIIRGYERIVQQRLLQSSDVSEFLMELEHIVVRLIEGKAAKQLAPAEFYSCLITHLNQVGWEYVTEFGPELTSFTIMAKDEAARSHALGVRVTFDFPSVKYPPTWVTQLPQDSFEVEWKQNTNLSDAVRLFTLELAKYQVFWDVCDDWDRNTWVLEPRHTDRSCLSRRVVISRSVSVYVLINLTQPRSISPCRFFGPDSTIKELQQLFSANLHTWDDGLHPRENLQTILKITFPTKNVGDSGSYDVQCGICYDYAKDEKIPERVCDNVTCARGFHVECLYEWLKALPSTRRSFNTLFGQCPYCTSPITVEPL